MEDVKKRELYGRLLSCRGELVNDHPFFGRLLLRLILGFVPCSTAYTDMRHIVFDPDFGASLNDEQLKFVLLHEVMHCVLKHCVRGQTLLPGLYNIACDIVVNSLALEILGLTKLEIRGRTPMHLAPDGKEGKEYTAEEVYAMLLKKGAGGNGQCPPTLDDHDGWAQIQDDGLSDVWESWVREAAAHTGGAPGSVPVMMERQLRELTRSPGVNWRQLLADFLRHTRSDYLFEYPDRRYAGGDVILPSFRENVWGESIGRIWVLIDTSGSVSEAGLEQAYAEVAELIRQTGELEGRLSFFDVFVTEPKEFTNEKELSEIKPVGGGGTSFTAIFESMRKYFPDELPTAVIILTDGYAYFPEEEKAEGVPVLWIMISSPVDAPWGVTAHVETD